MAVSVEYFKNKNNIQLYLINKQNIGKHAWVLL